WQRWWGWKIGWLRHGISPPSLRSPPRAYRQPDHHDAEDTERDQSAGDEQRGLIPDKLRPVLAREDDPADAGDQQDHADQDQECGQAAVGLIGRRRRPPVRIAR